MMDSRKLLADYAENGSEPAFRELVSRYINLVYSTAFRLAGGNRPLAEDITQTVFINLSSMARTISPDSMLGGWLHQHTFHVATKAVRAEQRRQNRENEAAHMNALNDHPNLGLREAAPILDEAITQLGKEDRTAILLRYFEQQDFQAVGVALGTNEDAARMRVNRALDKLQGILKSRGVTLSATALGAALAAEAVIAAPVGLAATVTGAVVAGSAAAGGVSATLIKIMAITKLKLVAGGVMAGLAAAVVVQSQNVSHLREQNEQLQKQVAGMSDLRAENERLAKAPVVTNEPALPQEQLNELLRLRGQVGSLKRQLADTSRNKPQTMANVPPPLDPVAKAKQESELTQLAIAKMVASKDWMLAFVMYAEDHQGQMPANFDQAMAYVGEERRREMLLATNQLEVVYQGARNAIPSPSSTIVLRETQPTQYPDGSWTRAYGFADGHSEIHKSADGNFTDWETGKIIKPPGQ